MQIYLFVNLEILKDYIKKLERFTGIDAPYEEPIKPELVVETDKYDILECANQVVDYLVEKILLNKIIMNIEKWGVKNHGGNPTTNESKKYAIFIGRYQPYHQGHISLIMQKINNGIPALIMVRDIAPDAKNPFTTEQTVDMIKKYHAAHNHDVEVIIIPDMESVNFGRGVGYEINEFSPPENIGWISATKIRDQSKKVIMIGEN